MFIQSISFQRIGASERLPSIPLHWFFLLHWFSLYEHLTILKLQGLFLFLKVDFVCQGILNQILLHVSQLMLLLLVRLLECSNISFHLLYSLFMASSLIISFFLHAFNSLINHFVDLLLYSLSKVPHTLESHLFGVVLLEYLTLHLTHFVLVCLVLLISYLLLLFYVFEKLGLCAVFKLSIQVSFGHF